MTTMAVVKDMGLGINIGNTFEAVIVCDPGDQGCENWVNGMETLETSWGSPAITEAMIRGYANAGFKTIRIPVAWSNKMAGDEKNGTYTISPALLNRVQEVVGWVLGNGMYAIVNIHYDGGWWENFPADSAECMKKYKRVWEQVSNRFKDHSGYLIFESLNEEGVWQDVWNRHNNSGNKARAYGLLNAINQEFTTLVRASGGNNANRHLLIAGYATDINLTSDPMFEMPADPQNHQAVSVHYYDPFGFTHLTQNESWAQMRLTWGTTADYDELNGYMNTLKTTFVENGIPIIVGEYGVAAPNRSESEIRKYTLAVAEAIYERNMCPVLWDVQLNDGETQYYYNRKANPPSLVDQLLVAGFKEITEENIVAALPQTATLNSAFATKNSIFLNVQKSAHLEIYKLNGKQERVLSFKNGAHSVSLVDLPSGMYIAKVSFGSEKQIFRITR